MGFEKFGKHGYIDQTKIARMMDFLGKGQIPATKCKTCGTTYFPPRLDCSKCRGSDFDWFILGPNCKLITFTKVFFGPPQFQKETPYILGLAEFDNGLRVFAPIRGPIDLKSLIPGTRLTLRTTKSESGSFYSLEKIE